jgi:CxxC motif-containing protein (DUF1111 family)
MKNIRILSLVSLLASGLFAVNTPAIYTSDLSKKALSKPYSNLNDEEQDQFMLGKSFFRIPWVEAPSATTARDGLGPLFNANACISCHPNNSLGSVYTKDGNISRSMVVRLSVPANGSKAQETLISQMGFIPEPTYGAQLSLNGTNDTPFEGKLNITYRNHYVTYTDGQTVVLSKPTYTLTQLNYGTLSKEVSISVRKAPPLIALGLIEQIPNEAILANEDIEDKNNDGISGKANRVYSVELKKMTLGKYTYKASAPTVRHQIAAAFNNDMGITTTLFPTENCTKSQQECMDAPKARDAIDVPDNRLDAMNFYLTHLKVPINPQKEDEGKKLFEDIGCASCHTPSFNTVNNEKVNVYSDFLLHDMGEALSDNRKEFDASKNEWRTAPLIGLSVYESTIGQKPDYLHDGRAKSLEEAILWHGGEAFGVKKRFMALRASQREAILRFLGTL